MADDPPSRCVDPRNLVGELEVIEALTLLTSRCVELSGADAAAVLLGDSTGHVSVVGATTERVRQLELVQIQENEGPGLDCFRRGELVVADLVGRSPWPRFAAESVRSGFPSVSAVPVGLNDVIVGSLDLFMSESVRVADADVALVRALADVASIAIIRVEPTGEAVIHEGQLQNALRRRIVVEQAVGMIAERAHVGVDEALRRLRAFARNTDQGLTDVADQVVARTLILDDQDGGRPTWPSGEGR